MPKYLVELAMLTRSTALVVVDSEGEPDLSDMQEAYAEYDQDTWNDDPDYCEEGTHQLVSKIEDGKVEGFLGIETLQVVKLADDPKVIANVADLAENLGAEPTEDSIAKYIYKATSCGAWFTITDDATNIEIGSIVEGVDQEVGPEVLTFPFTETELDAAIQAVEDGVSEVWNTTHGCEKCGPEDEGGYIHTNPECPACKGEGTVI